MKKLLKALLFIGGTAMAAHFGMKAFKRVNGAIKLSKSLPEFLSNVYGEFPVININRSLNSMNINVGFTQEILDKHDDIENTIREYIDDFYPEVAKCSVEIDVHVKGEESEAPEAEPVEEEKE